MFLLTFGRCGKAEWRQNAATDALVDMVRKLTFGRWGDIAGKMHTLGRWGILFSLGMSVRVVFRSGAAVGGSWETFFERKTGFELALISLPLGSKSARVFRAFLYPPRPSTGGRRRSWGEPRFPLGCWWQYKKRPRRRCCGRWFLGNFIERKTGFEPATFGLGSRRSTS